MPALPLPADVMTVISALLLLGGVIGLFAGYAERRWPLTALVATGLGVAGISWVWQVVGAFGWTTVPDAFIEVAARIL